MLYYEWKNEKKKEKPNMTRISPKILQQLKFKNFLNVPNPASKIKIQQEPLIDLVPEIADMIDFEHNHPHHHLDVWNHTLLALSLAPEDFQIRLAVLLHDIGKPHCYQEKNGYRSFVGHAEKSYEITKSILDRCLFEENFANEVCEMVRLHDTALTKEYIRHNFELSQKIFEVQKCDAMAHNPDKNAKRELYIAQTEKLFEQIANEKQLER